MAVSYTHLDVYKRQELGIIGWSEGIGLWAQVVGSLFTLLAMLTTYWSISLALSDILEEQTRWGKRLCWLIATLPSLLLVLLNLGSFLEIMRTAGGLIAILMAFMGSPLDTDGATHGHQQKRRKHDGLHRSTCQRIGQQHLSVCFAAATKCGHHHERHKNGNCLLYTSR